MNALKLLEEDHKKVKKLMGEIEPTTERGVKTREELFTKLRGELEVHEAIEEEIFYPALKEHPKAKDLVLEAYEEHNVVDMVMGEIEDVAYDDETWGAKFTVLKENLEHHIEEEESDMWKQARASSTMTSSTSSETGCRRGSRSCSARPGRRNRADQAVRGPTIRSMKPRSQPTRLVVLSAFNAASSRARSTSGSSLISAAASIASTVSSAAACAACATT